MKKKKSFSKFHFLRELHHSSKDNKWDKCLIVIMWASLYFSNEIPDRQTRQKKKRINS